MLKKNVTFKEIQKKMTKEMKYDIYSLPSVLMLQHEMDTEMVKDLNDYLDDLQ